MLRRCRLVYIVVAIALIDTTEGFVLRQSPPSSAYRALRQPKLRSSSVKANHPNLCAAAVHDEVVDLCIVGGGVSGLAAALTATKLRTESKQSSVLLLEATPTFGGRVQTDVTQDGLFLDRGFAVFIEQYPYARRLLDFDALQLCPFQPGALVKLDGKQELARIADPLRQPSALFEAIFSPIGTLSDKIKVARLVVHVRLNSIEDLVSEVETDTMTALKERWGISEGMISTFFKPFFQGIFLCPLSEQSSRLFHFVFKMFSEGSASVPKRGIGAVSQQLVEQQTSAVLRANSPVRRIGIEPDGSFLVESPSNPTVKARSVIVATEGPSSKLLLSTMQGYEDLKHVQDQPQRTVGCLYYSFRGPPPVSDPILILNGASKSSKAEITSPINNICFPSVVTHPDCGPKERNVCSVAVLEDALLFYDDKTLDQAVRQQLSDWFPANRIEDWKLERIYRIPNAQPAQLGGPQPANGLRPNNEYRGRILPPGVFVCGDHVSTASLNGALESGCNAADAAAAYLRTSQAPTWLQLEK